MSPTAADFVRAFLRCFASQASWNYRIYVAGGLTYALLPLLTRIHAGHPLRLRESVERNLETFNAHPYLTPMAVGALARLERDGASAEEIRRFRQGLSASLGAVGDALVWCAWRPLCLLSGLLAYTFGATPWTAILLFLIPYNVGHLVLRIWGFRRGWLEGREVGRRLSSPSLRRLTRGLRTAALVLVGGAVVAAGLLVGPSEALPAAAAAACAGAVVGYLRSGPAGVAAVSVLGVVVVLRLVTLG